MAILFHIPTYLQTFTGGCGRVPVNAQGHSLNDVLAALWKEHPGLRDRVLTEQNQVRQHLNIFVGADNIRDLLASTKEESELTMCSDVDRNDKSRVCEPGSVKVIGRRLIERYAGVFHTVDHVEGILAPGFDSLDAFLTHMWAVTIIGAPKK